MNITYEEAKQIVNNDTSKALYSKKFEISGKKFEIFNYRFVDKDTFNNPKSLELRGLCFELENKKAIYSIHKFFNYNENEYVMNCLELNSEVEVFEKVDGSLITPFYIDEKLFVKSKGSFNSEQAKKAKELIKNNDNIEKFIKYCANKELYPQFEYVGPKNQIVIFYPEEKLILLHIRDKNGNYLNYNEIKQLAKVFNLDIVKRNLVNFSELLEKIETEINIEGWVINNINSKNHYQKFIKLKTKWYMERHHLISKLNTVTIYQKILNEEIDDLLSFLNTLIINKENLNNFSETTSKKIKHITKLQKLLNKIFNIYYIEKEKMLVDFYSLTKKEFALKWKNNFYFPVFMAELKGISPRKYFIKYASNEKKINHLIKMFEKQYIKKGK